MRAPALIALFALLASLAACSKQSMEGYPTLLPMDEILTDQPLTPDPAPELEARADALRSRADAMRSQ
ncbi:hypothetical protein BMI91_03340 [Thioclava sediminum]|uniref:Lipoprotein n=1 Tax=Thioclava sediminum TaxID=1915319 RepID=A0ABX3N1E5_9RHOB|nr:MULTISPECIES: hypothetical protein [Thioclava]MAQ37350.1 hypothetical protein [Thioclava sp.]OOY21590.1 hypothetical protein BMI86_03250 [Thioclava sp. DLFJ5-1]OOY25456.1 hypothetical protein BMI91_03340 [Thioclava sediminum]|tara:strand:+ start:40 stop:243 length:204 start_codon:yes stop_codon:yes gene_type:complete